MTTTLLPTHTTSPNPRVAIVQYSSRRVQDFPQGYPRFAAFTSVHPSFFVFRRFANLRARMLLYKQDNLSVLETRLHQIDDEERKKLFLGSHRKDKNGERHQVLAELDTAMTEYDCLLNRTRKFLKWASAKTRDVSSLKSWLGENGCLSRDETAYLWQDDLMATWENDPDDVFQFLETCVEDFMIWLSSRLKKDFRNQRHRYPNLHIFPEKAVNCIARIALALIPTTVLLVPVLIVTVVQSTTLRLCLVFIASMISVATLSVMARVRIGELFIAGATYAAVLVVYIANNTQEA